MFAVTSFNFDRVDVLVCTCGLGDFDRVVRLNKVDFFLPPASDFPGFPFGLAVLDLVLVFVMGDR